MVFDFLFKKTGKELDDNKYFNYSITKQQLDILRSQENEQFKRVLLEVIEQKLAENINLLVHCKKGDEEKFKAVVRVYEDLINFFKETPEQKPVKKYSDLLKKVTRLKNLDNL